eukprot:752278-Hanusia_phi.AAC.6
MQFYATFDASRQHRACWPMTHSVLQLNPIQSLISSPPHLNTLSPPKSIVPCFCPPWDLTGMAWTPNSFTHLTNRQQKIRRDLSLTTLALRRAGRCEGAWRLREGEAGERAGHGWDNIFGENLLNRCPDRNSRDAFL